MFSYTLVAKLVLAHYSWNKYADDLDGILEAKARSLVQNVLKFSVEENLLSAVCFVFTFSVVMDSFVNQLIQSI